MALKQGDQRRYWGVVAPMPAAVIGMMVKQAEAQGLEGVFAPQVLGPPWVPLAVAAAHSERLKLGSGIAIAAARSPFETAMAAIDMDRISGGRFVLGLGASVHAWTCGVFGAPDHKPLTHLRETVAAVRHIIRGAHKGLEPFEGQYYRADFSALQPLAPPVREEIPVWIAALRGPAVRLAAEVADGVMGHPIWSIEWAVEQMQPELAKGLARGNRRRDDVELNLWLWCAPNANEAEAIEDARATVAFYAAAEQYESFFAAHGFRDEARRIQERLRQRDVLEHTDLVPDDMVRTFVQCGKPEVVRERVERAWTVADSLCLVPPAYALPPEKALQYQTEIANLFY
jgi:probable F420-dependent oxidoreductase